MVGGTQGRRRQGAADLRRAQAAGQGRVRPGAPGAGFVHAGPVGAGHFSKMVHNGIEYAMMQAYGEGYELLAAVDLIEDVPGRHQVLDAGHRHPLLAAGPAGPGAGRGPGAGADHAATPRTPARAGGPSSRRIENAVPMPAIAASLFARFASRQDDSPTMKAVAALRNQFGGHAVHAVRAQEAEKPA